MTDDERTKRDEEISEIENPEEPPARRHSRP